MTRLKSLTYKDVFLKVSYKSVEGEKEAKKHERKGTDQTQIANKHSKLIRFPNKK